MKSIVWIGVFVLCSVAGAQTPAPPPPTPAPPPTVAPLAATPIAAPEENIENMTSFALYNWRPDGGPSLIGGALSSNVAAQSLVLPNKPSQANGLTVTVRAKGPTRVEISLFDLRDSGNTIASRDLSLFGVNIPSATNLSVDYRLRNLKVSWNYLTYPVPSLDSKLRVKTLFEVQYLQIKPLIAFPFNPVDAVSTKQSIIYPTFGMGLEYVPSPKHFRVEARFSGFGLPNRAAIWDGEGSLVGRFGPVEIFAGEKAYHFRTSPGKDIYTKATLWGPYFGLRWVFR